MNFKRNKQNSKHNRLHCYARVPIVSEYRTMQCWYSTIFKSIFFKPEHDRYLQVGTSSKYMVPHIPIQPSLLGRFLLQILICESFNIAYMKTKR